jgi:hypothetical protein
MIPDVAQARSPDRGIRGGTFGATGGSFRDAGRKLMRITDHSGAAADAEGPIVLYDGVCGLCDRSVQLILRNDRRGRFRFAALQSNAGRALLERFGLSPEALDSVVLVQGGRAWRKSQAAPPPIPCADRTSGAESPEKQRGRGATCSPSSSFRGHRGCSCSAPGKAPFIVRMKQTSLRTPYAWQLMTLISLSMPSSVDLARTLP